MREKKKAPLWIIIGQTIIRISFSVWLLVLIQFQVHSWALTFTMSLILLYIEIESIANRLQQENFRALMGIVEAQTQHLTAALRKGAGAPHSKATS
jgi:hypothetical protein